MNELFIRQQGYLRLRIFTGGDVVDVFFARETNQRKTLRQRTTKQLQNTGTVASGATLLSLLLESSRSQDWLGTPNPNTK